MNSNYSFDIKNDNDINNIPFKPCVLKYNNFNLFNKDNSINKSNSFNNLMIHEPFNISYNSTKEKTELNNNILHNKKENNKLNYSKSFKNLLINEINNPRFREKSNNIKKNLKYLKFYNNSDSNKNKNNNIKIKNFLSRNYFNKNNTKNNSNNQLNKKCYSQTDILNCLNRLIDDANRRLCAEENKEIILNEINDRLNNNNKKYNKKEWENIYKKRFLSFKIKCDLKIKEKNLEKEKLIKEEEKKIENEIKNKKVTKPLQSIKKYSEILYNKGRKIYTKKNDEIKIIYKNHNIKNDKNKKIDFLKKNKSFNLKTNKSNKNIKENNNNKRINTISNYLHEFKQKIIINQYNSNKNFNYNKNNEKNIKYNKTIDNKSENNLMFINQNQNNFSRNYNEQHIIKINNILKNDSTFINSNTNSKINLFPSLKEYNNNIYCKNKNNIKNNNNCLKNKKQKTHKVSKSLCNFSTNDIQYIEKNFFNFFHK